MLQADRLVGKTVGPEGATFKPQACLSLDMELWGVTITQISPFAGSSAPGWVPSSHTAVKVVAADDIA